MRRSHRGTTGGYHRGGHQRKALGAEGAKMNLKFRGAWEIGNIKSSPNITLPESN